MSVLYSLNNNPLPEYGLEISCPISLLAFSFFLIVSFDMQNLFHWLKLHLVICAFSIISKKCLPRPMSKSFSHIFSSKSFTVLGLIFTLKFIFMSGVRLGSNFILFMWLFSFPKIISWRAYPFPSSIRDTLVNHQSTVMHGFISGFYILFFFFFICLYVNTMLHLLSCFSCIQLYAILWTAALQIPLSVGFSRQ